MTETPFTWNYLGNEIPCRFLAGLGAVIQNVLAISPLTIWAVRMDEAALAPGAP